MASGHFEFQSDFARKHRGEGRTEGRAEAVIAFLEARALLVDDAAHARILGCTDLTMLDRWVRRAATIDTLEELFQD